MSDVILAVFTLDLSTSWDIKTSFTRLARAAVRRFVLRSMMKLYHYHDHLFSRLLRLVKPHYVHLLNITYILLQFVQLLFNAMEYHKY